VLPSAAQAVSTKLPAGDAVFGVQLMGVAYFFGWSLQLSNNIVRLIIMFLLH